MRAIPDVAYDANPATGFPIYVKGAWHTVGGTSAGAPQWAAIAALGRGITNAQLYADKSTGEHAKYFRDITSGQKRLVRIFLRRAHALRLRHRPRLSANFRLLGKIKKIYILLPLAARSAHK